MKKEEYIFDANTLSHIAELAKLDISEEQAELMLPQMREIICFASEICSAEPSCAMQDGDALEDSNRLREDIPQKSFSREELMSTASKSADGYFVVPDVLGSGGEA